METSPEASADGAPIATAVIRRGHTPILGVACSALIGALSPNCSVRPKMPRGAATRTIWRRMWLACRLVSAGFDDGKGAQFFATSTGAADGGGRGDAGVACLGFATRPAAGPMAHLRA